MLLCNTIILLDIKTILVIYNIVCIIGINTLNHYIMKYLSIALSTFHCFNLLIYEIINNKIINLDNIFVDYFIKKKFNIILFCEVLTTEEVFILYTYDIVN